MKSKSFFNITFFPVKVPLLTAVAKSSNCSILVISKSASSSSVYVGSGNVMFFHCAICAADTVLSSASSSPVIVKTSTFASSSYPSGVPTSIAL